jgi:hypothetical protein
MIAFLFQSLSFLWFGTPIFIDKENECNLFYGSSTNIGAALVWLISSILVLCWYPTPTSTPKTEGVICLSEMHYDNVETSKSMKTISKFVFTTSQFTEMGPAKAQQIVDITIV